LRKQHFHRDIRQQGAAKQWIIPGEELKKAASTAISASKWRDIEGYRQGLVAKGLAVTEVTGVWTTRSSAGSKTPGTGNDITLMEYTPGSYQLRA